MSSVRGPSELVCARSADAPRKPEANKAGFHSLHEYAMLLGPTALPRLWDRPSTGTRQRAWPYPSIAKARQEEAVTSRTARRVGFLFGQLFPATSSHRTVPEYAPEPPRSLNAAVSDSIQTPPTVPNCALQCAPQLAAARLLHPGAVLLPPRISLGLPTPKGNAAIWTVRRGGAVVSDCSADWAEYLGKVYLNPHPVRIFRQPSFNEGICS